MTFLVGVIGPEAVIGGLHPYLSCTYIKSFVKSRPARVRCGPYRGNAILGGGAWIYEGASIRISKRTIHIGKLQSEAVYGLTDRPCSH